MCEYCYEIGMCEGISLCTGLKMLVAGIGKINLNKSHVIRYPKHANRLLYLNKAFYSETTRNLQ